MSVEIGDGVIFAMWGLTKGFDLVVAKESKQNPISQYA